jgi:hypothetical protein
MGKFGRGGWEGVLSQLRQEGYLPGRLSKHGGWENLGRGGWGVVLVRRDRRAIYRADLANMEGPGKLMVNTGKPSSLNLTTLAYSCNSAVSRSR